MSLSSAFHLFSVDPGLARGAPRRRFLVEPLAASLTMFMPSDLTASGDDGIIDDVPAASDTRPGAAASAQGVGARLPPSDAGSS